MCPLRWKYESLCQRFRATPVVSLLLRLAVEGHYNRCKNRQLTGVCFTLRARGFGCRPADLKGAKIWSVMRCACKCDAIRQVQALRRSCRRSPETENEALPNRRAHVGNVIDAGANDFNSCYTPTSLDGDEPRRRRTSDRDTQSALISPSARRWHWPAVTCELALYQGVARGEAECRRWRL